MIRAVLDTIVLVSAEITKGGKPGQILRRADRFEWLTSEYILRELAQVLARPHILAKFPKPATRKARSRYEKLIRAETTIVNVTTAVTAVSADLKDNPILACAKDGEADYVVTGDRHLLALGAFEGIKIVTPGAISGRSGNPTSGLAQTSPDLMGLGFARASRRFVRI